MALKLGESPIGLGLINEPALHGQPLRPASGHRIELCVYVEDVDEKLFGRHPARVVLEPVDQP